MQNKIFDIECYPNLFYLLTRDIDTGEYNEYTLGNRLFTDLIYNPDVNLIGWNNHSYDNLLLNYIATETQPASNGWGKQLAKQVTEENLYKLSTQIITASRSENNEYLKYLRFAELPYQSQDIKALLDPMPGLKKIEMRMGFWNVQDLPLPPGTILTDEQIGIVKKYCRNDVDATYEIYTQYALQHIELRTYLARRFRLPASKLQSASEPRTAEYILSTQATQHNHKSPWEIKDSLQLTDSVTPPVVHVTDCIPDWINFKTISLQTLCNDLTPYKLSLNENGHPRSSNLKRIITVGTKEYQIGAGGLHSVDTPGNWFASDAYSLIDADVTSYYPSILLRDNLYPRGYDEYWSHAYQRIYTERLQAKQDPSREIEAHALKIILNATFGKFGSHFSSFYDPTLLIRVTLTGQLALLMLIEACAEKEIEVLSANTDGILIKLMNNQQDLWTKICDWWQRHTRFNLEYSYYRRYARRDVNNYTALTTDNKIKNKGIFTPPDLKHDVQAPIIQTLARRYLLYDEEPVINPEELTIKNFIFHFGATSAYQIYLRTKSVVNALKQQDNPIDWKELNLSKSNRWYVGPDSLNNILVKTGGKLGNTIKIPNGSNIVLCNQITDLTLPKDINFDYYIQKTWDLIRSCESND